jgi:predicted negative regulator of RcsB-dependent stress response
MADVNQVQQTEERNEVVDRMTGFWDKNNKAIVMAFAALIIVVGGYFGYKYLVKEPNEKKASDAIFRAESYYRADSLNLALNGDNVNPGFVKVASKFSGTKAGNLANFYAGDCYLKLGDYANAIKYLKAFSTSSKQFEARALALLGDAYADSGKKEEAIDEYKKAGTLFEKDDYNSPEYLFRAGLLSETLGKTKEAIELYKTIQTKYPRSERGMSIDKYLARLGVTE